MMETTTSKMKTKTNIKTGRHISSLSSYTKSLPNTSNDHMDDLQNSTFAIYRGGLELRNSAIQTNTIAKCCTFLCSCTFMISHSSRGWPRLSNDSWRDVGQLIVSQISYHVAEVCPVDPCKLTSAVEVHLIATAWLAGSLTKATY